MLVEIGIGHGNAKVRAAWGTGSEEKWVGAVCAGWATWAIWWKSDRGVWLILGRALMDGDGGDDDWEQEWEKEGEGRARDGGSDFEQTWSVISRGLFNHVTWRTYVVVPGHGIY